MSVKGRTAVVTGGASGIGAGIAFSLAEQGARIAILDVNAEQGEEVASGLRDKGFAAIAIGVDLTDSDEVAGAFDDLETHFSGVEILVNNAGVIDDDIGFADMTEASWDRIMAINTKSQFLCSRRAAKTMISQRRGRIINIASRSWLGNVGIANYSASKGAVVSLTRSLAIELGPHGVTANCISPTLIVTPLFQNMPPEVQAADIERASKQPIPRMGQASDVALVVSFFASDAADFITGQHIYVGGGADLWYSTP